MEKHEIKALADAIYDKFNSMNVMELDQLNKAVEKAFGIKATPVMIPGKEPIVEEKDTFDVVLKSFGENKVKVIKAVRGALGLGLKEAKNLVDSVPVTIKEEIRMDDMTYLRGVLEDAGAVVEVV